MSLSSPSARLGSLVMARTAHTFVVVCSTQIEIFDHWKCRFVCYKTTTPLVAYLLTNQVTVSVGLYSTTNKYLFGFDQELNKVGGAPPPPLKIFIYPPLFANWLSIPIKWMPTGSTSLHLITLVLRLILSYNPSSVWRSHQEPPMHHRHSEPQTLWLLVNL
jgi:hypothetical protein